MGNLLKFQDYSALQVLPWQAVKPFDCRFGRVQFGYEAEYSLSEMGPWLHYYEPVESGVAKAEAEAWLHQKMRHLSHGDKGALLKKKAGPDFLPDTLFRDDTGNLECVLGPLESLAAFAAQSSWIEKNLGIGSLQAMLSVERERFFQTPWQAHLGFIAFFSELDVLERLARGAGRAEPARNFLHPYLGPLVSLRHKLLRKFLRENSQGNMLTPEELIRPARRDQSFKFVGSTAYRPDVAGPARVCFEVRDAHKNPDLLRNRMARLLFYWSKELQPFQRFSEVPPFDSATAFDALPESVRDWLKQVVPFRAPPEVLAFENPRFSYETFRNFAYPLRAWEPWLEILGATPGFYESVKLARGKYVSELETAASREESHPAAQRALCRFVSESGILAVFLGAEARLIREVEGG